MIRGSLTALDSMKEDFLRGMQSCEQFPTTCSVPVPRRLRAPGITERGKDTSTHDGF